MQRFIALIFSCLILSGVAGAQTDSEEIYLGYCNGINGEMGEISSSSANTVSSAICITPDMTTTLSGNHIQSLRMYFPSKINIGEVTVWVREGLDGENISEGRCVSKDVVKGWNNIALENPYTIESGKTFYLGYTYKQKGRSYGISCSGSYKEGGLYYQFDNEGWITDSKYGNLCLEGCVAGDKLPEYDIALVKAYMGRLYYVGNPLTVSITVMNRGIKVIEGFTLGYEIPGVGTETTHLECNLNPNDIQEIEVSFPSIDLPYTESTPMTLTISAIDGGKDINLADNVYSFEFKSVCNLYERVVLMEEFTTEKCVNCPPAAAKVLGAAKNIEERHPGSLAVICHHAGYGTDFLTTPDDEALCELYGATTYAPAMMINRTIESGFPVMNVKSLDEIEAMLEDALVDNTLIGMKIEAEYDEITNNVNVDISGERLYDFTDTPLNISVVIVENNIKIQKQVGADAGYTHQHVYRCGNSTWGETIDWDNNFTYSYELPVDENWNKQNLDIIAYVSQYDNLDIKKRKVENARIIHFNALTGIDRVEAELVCPKIKVVNGKILTDDTHRVETVRSADGLSVRNENLSSGLYIIRVIGIGEERPQTIKIRL